MKNLIQILTILFTLSISQLAYADIAIDYITAISSEDANDGTIALHAEGTAGDFTLLLQGGGMPTEIMGINGSYIFTGLYGGDYTITVTDAFGCVTVLTAHIAICEREGYFVNIHVIREASCGPGQTGGAMGVSEFRYINDEGHERGVEDWHITWGDLGVGGYIHHLTGNPTNLQVGIYHVTLVDNTTGCIFETSYDLGGYGILVDLMEILHHCNNESEPNGSIRLIIGNASVNPLLVEYNGTPIEQTDDPSNSPDLGEYLFEGLAPGEYCIDAYDSSDLNCHIHYCWTIEDYDATLLPEINLQYIENTCFDYNSGEIVLDVTGNGPFTYEWSGTSQTNESVDELAGGTHIVTVTDLCGNTATASYEIGVFPDFDVHLQSIRHYRPGSGGSITLTYTGAGPVSFQWRQIGGSYLGTGSTKGNLSPGRYLVEAAQLNTGCVIKQIYEITFCNNVPDFNIKVIGGLFFDEETDEIEMKVLIQEDGGLFSEEIPLGYSVNWQRNGATISNASHVVLGRESIGSGVAVYVSNGCVEKEIYKPILGCEETDTDLLESYFVTEVRKPCVGFADGIIELTIPIYEGIEVDVLVNNSLVLVIPEGSIFGDYAIVPVTDLQAGNYTFKITIGDCIFEFDKRLSTKPFNDVFIGYDSSVGENGVCNYVRMCGDINLGPHQEAAYINFNDEYNEVCGSLGPFCCKAQISCPGVEERVGIKDYGYKKISAGEYWYILQTASAEGIFDECIIEGYRQQFSWYFSYEYICNSPSQSNIEVCDKIKYCPATLHARYHGDIGDGTGTWGQG